MSNTEVIVLRRGPGPRRLVLEITAAVAVYLGRSRIVLTPAEIAVRGLLGTDGRRLLRAGVHHDDTFDVELLARQHPGIVSWVSPSASARRRDARGRIGCWPCPRHRSPVRPVRCPPPGSCCGRRGAGTCAP